MNTAQSTLRVVSRNGKSIRPKHQQPRLLAAGKIAVCQVDGLRLINISELEYCKASSNYTELNLVSGETILISKSLKSICGSLPSTLFLRVHQSFLINKTHVTHFRNSGIRVASGIDIPVARSKRSHIAQALTTHYIKL